MKYKIATLLLLVSTSLLAQDSSGVNSTPTPGFSRPEYSRGASDQQLSSSQELQRALQYQYEINHPHKNFFRRHPWIVTVFVSTVAGVATYELTKPGDVVQKHLFTTTPVSTFPRPLSY